MANPVGAAAEAASPAAAPGMLLQGVRDMSWGQAGIGYKHMTHWKVNQVQGNAAVYRTLTAARLCSGNQESTTASPQVVTSCPAA